MKPFTKFSRQTQTLSGKQGRKEKFDKMCIYLRLFLGMGILWYFEILAFALRDAEISSDWLVFTNILNLMQVQSSFLSTSS